LERAPKPKVSGTKRPKEDGEEDRQAKKPKLEEAVVHPPVGPIAFEPSAEVVLAQAGGQMDVDHVEAEENGDKGEKELKARPSGSYKEEPYTFLDPESEDLKSCL